MLFLCTKKIKQDLEMSTTTVKRIEISKFLYATILVAVYVIAVFA